MSLCRTCMAEITWATTRSGERIPIDEHEMIAAHRPDARDEEKPQRYRIVVTGETPLIEPVPDDFAAAAYVDHREICQQPRPT